VSGFAFHPEAFSDLDDIWEFIAQDNIDSADRTISDIFDALRALVSFPHKGHNRPDLTARPIRFILVRDYLIAFVPDESPLWIIAILHGRGNPRVMAAVLRNRT